MQVITQLLTQGRAGVPGAFGMSSPGQFGGGAYDTAANAQRQLAQQAAFNSMIANQQAVAQGVFGYQAGKPPTAMTATEAATTLAAGVVSATGVLGNGNMMNAFGMSQNAVAGGGFRVTNMPGMGGTSNGAMVAGEGAITDAIASSINRAIQNKILDGNNFGFGNAASGGFNREQMSTIFSHMSESGAFRGEVAGAITDAGGFAMDSAFEGKVSSALKAGAATLAKIRDVVGSDDIGRLMQEAEALSGTRMSSEASYQRAGRIVDQLRSSAAVSGVSQEAMFAQQKMMMAHGSAQLAGAMGLSVGDASAMASGIALAANRTATSRVSGAGLGDTSTYGASQSEMATELQQGGLRNMAATSPELLGLLSKLDTAKFAGDTAKVAELEALLAEGQGILATGDENAYGEWRNRVESSHGISSEGRAIARNTAKTGNLLSKHSVYSDGWTGAGVQGMLNNPEQFRRMTETLASQGYAVDQRDLQKVLDVTSDREGISRMLELTREDKSMQDVMTAMGGAEAFGATEAEQQATWEALKRMSGGLGTRMDERTFAALAESAAADQGFVVGKGRKSKLESDRVAVGKALTRLVDQSDKAPRSMAQNVLAGLLGQGAMDDGTLSRFLKDKGRDSYLANFSVNKTTGGLAFSNETELAEFGESFERHSGMSLRKKLGLSESASVADVRKALSSADKARDVLADLATGGGAFETDAKGNFSLLNLSKDDREMVNKEIDAATSAEERERVQKAGEEARKALDEAEKKKGEAPASASLDVGKDGSKTVVVTNMTVEGAVHFNGPSGGYA